MSDYSIRARLGLDFSDLRSGSTASKAEFDQLKDKARALSAAIALTQREMGNTRGTDEQITRLQSLRRELTLTEQQARITGKQLAAIEGAMPSRQTLVSTSGAGTGGGHGLGERSRTQELGHSARAFTEMMLAGQSPLRAAETEAPRLLQAFGGGVGSIVGVGALVGIASKLAEARTEAKHLREELNNLGNPMPTGAAASIEGITKRLGETQGVIKQLEEAQSGFWHVMSGTLGKRWDHFFSGNVFSAVREQGESDDAAMRGAQGQLDHQTHALAQTQKRDLGVDERAERGDNSADLERIRIRFAQEREQIEERVSKGELSRDTELIANSKEREALELRIEQHRQEAARAGIQLEDQLLAIKRQGADVEVKSAQARLAAALETLRAGPDMGNGYAANAEKVHAAQEELRVAERTRAERQEELGLRTAIAVLTDNADQRHLMSLALEEQKLKSRLASPAYGADEKANMAADLLGNQQAQHAAFQERIGRGNQAYLAERSAGYARGPEGQLQGIRDRRFVLGYEMEANTAGTDAGGQPVYKDANLHARQESEAASLKRQEEDILFTQQQQLASLRAQTSEMQEIEKGHSAVAKIEAIRARYEQEITQAVHDGRTDVANERRKQEKIAVRGAEADAANVTPAENAAADRKAEKARQDALRYEDRGRTHDANRDGSVIIDSQDKDTMIPYAGTRARDQGGTTAAGSPDDVDIPDNANIDDNPNIDDNKGMNFNDIGNSHMPDRSFEMPVPDGPNDQGNASRHDNSDVVAALDALCTTIITACTGSL